jgi:hypothetical protein
MPGLDIPPEALDELRQTDPVSCPFCADERGEANCDLTVVDRGADADLIGAVFRCSIGHVYLAGFIVLDGRIYFATVPVNAPAGPEIRN